MPGAALPPVSPQAPLDDDDKDTEADTPEAAETRRRRVAARKAGRREKSAVHEREPVIDEGPPITSVASGRLSDVRLHETKVRRRSSTLAGRRPSSTSGGPRVGFEIELARSLDSSQQIQRIGPDRVVIEGIATGPLDDDDRAPTVSLLVDGTLYAVGVESGDTAKETVERLAARLSRALKVEISDAGDERATLVVLGGRAG